MPAGIADGQRIRVSGRGHAGERGGPPGDLYVLVRVKEDSRFVRDGDDLVTAVDVSGPQAALGATVEVPTIDGPEELEIPAGTQPHETIVLRGRGMPSLRGRRQGDLRVVVNVITPRNLTPDAARAARALRRDAHAREPRKPRRGRVREAAPRLPPLRRAMLRLAVRVRRADAELVLAELLELAPSGVEEVDIDAQTVEYAVYGTAGRAARAARTCRRPPATHWST